MVSFGREPVGADAGPDRARAGCIARRGDLFGESGCLGRVGHRADRVERALRRATRPSPAAGAGEASCMSGATATVTSAPGRSRLTRRVQAVDERRHPRDAEAAPLVRQPVRVGEEIVGLLRVERCVGWCPAGLRTDRGAKLRESRPGCSRIDRSDSARSRNACRRRRSAARDRERWSRCSRPPPARSARRRVLRSRPSCVRVQRASLPTYAGLSGLDGGKLLRDVARHHQPRRDDGRRGARARPADRSRSR